MLKTILFFIAASIISVVAYFGWSLLTSSARIGTFCDDLFLAKSKTEAESMMRNYKAIRLKKTISEDKEYWQFYEYRSLGLDSCKIAFEGDRFTERAHR